MTAALSQKRSFEISRDAGWNLDIPASAHTLAGFREWVLSDEVPEKLRVSFLGGRISIDMRKEELFTHAAVKTVVAGALIDLNREIDFGSIYINGVLVTNVAAEVSNNPDMVGISWRSLDSGKVRNVQTHDDRAMEIEGSPDWLLEIVSDGSVKKDRRDLRQAYHKAGVREYWLIDARGADIDFQILTWRKSGFAAAPNRNGWLASRVFARTFQLTRKRDRAGNWQYYLAVGEG